MSKKAREAKKLRRMMAAELRKTNFEETLEFCFMDFLLNGSCATVIENGKIRRATAEDLERIDMTVKGVLKRAEIRFEEIKNRFIHAR